ncbi:transmembrane protein 205 [Anopheles stephensi]|uniref:TMEM205-like domain-containing protein n=1 Tax=Anopheles stephensi TaxID=30069 RepID=A0A182XYD6_ANOST|nr:transmembrane protein 205 [Anopheles stephensi]
MCCLQRMIDTTQLLQSKPNLPANVELLDDEKQTPGHQSAHPASEQIHQDVLGTATRATRSILHGLRDQTYRLQRSQLYKILTNTTQPSHAISAIVVSMVLVALWPNLISGQAAADAQKCMPEAGDSRGSPLTQIAYLGSFTIHFGAQIWMTFVSGLALYFSLPRHTFGLIQEVLFPKYFTLGTGLSTISLVSFVELRRSTRPELAARNLAHWDPVDLLQIAALAITASLELFVRLYLAPPMLRLMHEKHRIEAQASIGQEVGQFDGAGNGSLERSRHYKATHKKFRQIHMATAILNMVSLTCTCVHLLYLATRVTI